MAAPAGAAVHWRLQAHGIARGPAQSTPAAYVALDRAATARFAALLPADARASLAATDFAKNAVVAVFGEFGCTDHRIVVKSVNQHAGTVVVSLLLERLAPDTAECMAIYPTYRLLVIAKSQLARPYPTRATVTLARA